MYNINLIHEKIIPVRKQRKRLSLVSLYFLLWAVSAVVVAFFVITNNARIQESTKAVQTIGARNALPAGLTQTDVEALDRQLDASATVLKTIQRQTIRWGSKLRLLSRHLPKDAWFDRLSCRGTPPGQPPPGGQPGGQPPAPSAGEFIVEGMLLVPEGGMGTAPLEEYVAALREDKIFMIGLSKVDLQVVERKGIGRREVAVFRLICTVAEGIRVDA